MTDNNKKNSSWPESVSIVVPCFNEADTVSDVISELKSAISKYSWIKWEIIVIDDGSSDNTFNVINNIDGIVVLRHPVNRGYGAALKTGIQTAVNEYVLTFDSDGQHDAEYIPALLKDINGFDMTVGSRVDSSGVPLGRRPGKYILKALMSYMVGQKIEDLNSGLRVLHRETALKYLHLCSNQFSFSMSSTMALISDGKLVRFVPVKCKERHSSHSSVGIKAGFQTLLKIVVLGTTFVPMRVFMLPTTIMGVLWIASVIYDLSMLDIHDMTVFLGTGTITMFCFALLSDQIANIRREL